MANVYVRSGSANLWVKFRHPATGAVERASLGTVDPAKAALLCRKIEALALLADPVLASLELPPALGELFAVAPVVPAAPETSVLPVVAASPRRPAAEVARDYAMWCQASNSPHHARSKVGYLRRIFGSRAVPFPDGAQRAKEVEPFCDAACLEDISVGTMQWFIESISENACTRRHVREMVHQVWEFALKRSFLLPVNWHTPNPMSSLPCYADGPREIRFLNPDEVARQLEAVRSFPAIHVGVALMIHAGLRRAEALWMRREDVHLDEEYLSVVFKADEGAARNSLKTGQRSVAIVPELRAILRPVLAKSGPRWLVPSDVGTRMDKDNFSKKLARINGEKKLSFSCNEFRHTYATMRLAAGMSIFWLSKEMGSSVQTLTKHYAGYVRPLQMYQGTTEAVSSSFE